MLAFMKDTSAHPRAKCYKCYNESIPSRTRLALNEFQASCYSHHRSQSALSETNWLLRVSGCNPYLESLPSYIDGAPPWTPTNRGHEITSRPLKHDPETSPRDFKELRTDHGPNIIKQVSNMFITHIYPMSTFIINLFYILGQTHTNSSYSIHEYRILAHLVTMPLS